MCTHNRQYCLTFHALEQPWGRSQGTSVKNSLVTLWELFWDAIQPLYNHQPTKHYKSCLPSCRLDLERTYLKVGLRGCNKIGLLYNKTIFCLALYQPITHICIMRLSASWCHIWQYPWGQGRCTVGNGIKHHWSLCADRSSLVPRPPHVRRGSGVLSNISCHKGRGWSWIWDHQSDDRRHNYICMT